MTMKNDKKSEKELHYNGLVLTKLLNVWAKKV